MNGTITRLAAASDRPPVPPAAARAADATREQPAPPARVLVVEDDHFIGLDIEAALRDAGYDVVAIATTAEEAAEMARVLRPDMALMDIRLVSRRDGVDAAIEIYTEFGIRSLFATAHEDAEMRRRAAAAQPLSPLR